MNDEKYKGNEGQESPLVRQAREAIQQAATSVKEGIVNMNDEVAEEIRGFDRLKKDSSGITIPVRVIKQDRLREIVGEICGVYVDVVGQTYGPGGKDAIIQFPNGVFTIFEYLLCDMSVNPPDCATAAPDTHTANANVEKSFFIIAFCISFID